VGAFLCMAPAAIGAEVIVFVAIVAWTRYISMGSIVGAATFPLAVWLVQKSSVEFVAAAVIGGAFIIYKHAGNIARLRAGTENVFSFRSRRR
jgi:glycerol-3-phosphate acyltransferase PlsY